MFQQRRLVMADSNPGATPITDHRVRPRGVLPRALQTWIVAGLALVILGIIVFAGRPEPTERPAAPLTAAALVPSPDRLRDYQDRLRVIEARSQQQALDNAPEFPPMPGYGPLNGLTGFILGHDALTSRSARCFALGSPVPAKWPTQHSGMATCCIVRVLEVPVKSASLSGFVASLVTCITVFAAERRYGVMK